MVLPGMLLLLQMDLRPAQRLQPVLPDPAALLRLLLLPEGLLPAMLCPAGAVLRALLLRPGPLLCQWLVRRSRDAARPGAVRCGAIRAQFSPGHDAAGLQR